MAQMAEPTPQLEAVRLVDYYALQAVTFLADPELCFDVGSIESLNRVLDVYLRQLIDLSGRCIPEGPQRTMTARCVAYTLEMFNLKLQAE